MEHAGLGRPQALPLGGIRKEERVIYLWSPAFAKFKKLVEKGQLPGEVEADNTEDPDVILGELTPEHLKLISSDSAGVLFEWEHPGVLYRMGK